MIEMVTRYGDDRGSGRRDFDRCEDGDSDYDGCSDHRDFFFSNMATTAFFLRRRRSRALRSHYLTKVLGYFDLTQ